MAQNVNGSRKAGGENKGDDEAALRARLEKLSHALDARRGESTESGEQKDKDGSASSLQATNLGFQALIEFVTAVVVGPIIGWQIDAWLNTQPIFFIIFLILGMVAGLVNVYRLAVRPPGGKRNSQ